MKTLLSFILGLLALSNLVLLVMGFFSPNASLFWYKKRRTRVKSALIYGGLFVLLAVINSAITEPKDHVSSPLGIQEQVHHEDLMNESIERINSSKNIGEGNVTKYAKIGDLISVGHFQYKVNNIQFKKTIGNNPYASETADGIFLIVDLTIRNVDREARTLDDSFYKLTDEQGVEYSTGDSKVMVAMSVDGKETLFLKEFNPNISKKGYLVFEVPQKSVYDLHLSGGFWTGETYAVKLTP